MDADIIEILECTSPAGEGLYTQALAPFFERMKRLGRWGEIVRGCLKVLDLYPEDVRTRSILADAYLSMGFLSLAEAEITKIRKTLLAISSLCDSRCAAFSTQAAEGPSQLGGASGEEEDADITMPELATPTLAELYLSQGRRQEAIAIYEKILACDPANKAARDRIAELKGESGSRVHSAGQGQSEQGNTLYMIKVLEQWLDRLRNASHA